MSDRFVFEIFLMSVNGDFIFIWLAVTIIMIKLSLLVCLSVYLSVCVTSPNSDQEFSRRIFFCLSSHLNVFMQSVSIPGAMKASFSVACICPYFSQVKQLTSPPSYLSVGFARKCRWKRHVDFSTTWTATGRTTMASGDTRAAKPWPQIWWRDSGPGS